MNGPKFAGSLFAVLVQMITRLFDRYPITVGVGFAALMGLGLMTTVDHSPYPVVTTPKASATPGVPKKAPVPSASPSKKPSGPKVLRTRNFRASYFWDDGSGVNGDTGAPASGKHMQKGLFASPMWPLGTKVRVTRSKRSVTGFIGDFGPGTPAQRSYHPILIDLDTYTFRYLYDGHKPTSRYNAGSVTPGSIKVKVEVLKWGTGRTFKGRSKNWRN